MTRIKARPVFDPKRPMVAQRSFRAAGKRFTAGDPFPWKQMAITQRRVQQMYEGGQLSMEPIVEEKPVFDLGDDEPDLEPDNLSDLSMSDLREMARGRGVSPIPRKKAEIIQAILDAWHG